MSKYFKDHNRIRVTADGATQIFDLLPPAQYILKFDPLTGFFLEENTRFNLPEKIFGDVEKKSTRVLKTYFARNCNTGVLLSGDKGAGKTMFARLLSEKAIDQGIPTIIINDRFEGDNFNKFLSDIDDRCLILFDEFEKVFSKDEEQNSVLTLFDGTYQSNKLFVLTVNSVFKVSDFILNRPGRVYYHIRYDNIEAEFIREYCDYHLDNKSYKESVVDLGRIVGKFNFDMLKAVVQECNIHEEPPSAVYKMMNIDLDSARSKYSYTLMHNKQEKKQTGTHTVSIYDSFYLYWVGTSKPDEDDDEEELVDGERSQSLSFQYSDLVKLDKDSGVFIYEKGNFRLEMKREKNSFFAFDLI